MVVEVKFNEWTADRRLRQPIFLGVRDDRKGEGRRDRTPATIERSVKARGAATVYVDYLQNTQGKTVAGPYCVRAMPGATVSTPLKWTEVTDKLDPRAFHLGNAAERFEKVGNIWGEAMKKKNSLRALV